MTLASIKIPKKWLLRIEFLFNFSTKHFYAKNLAEYFVASPHKDNPQCAQSALICETSSPVKVLNYTLAPNTFMAKIKLNISSHHRMKITRSVQTVHWYAKHLVR
jgi:hypothetical protein